MAIDQDKLGEFLGRFVGDLGATIAAGSIVVGDRLGLYRGLAPAPASADELAGRTGTDPRYVAEWLRGQAAGGYVEYDAQADSYSMTEEQAFALTDPDGAVYVPGAFQLALGTLRSEPRIVEAFRSGSGVGWHEHDAEVFEGCERFFRPGYIANLIPSWVPSLDGVQAKLQAGGKIADIGCGHGASSVLFAQAYPASTVVGSDYHDGSIESARKRAAGAGVADRVSFEVASAQTFSGGDYDLVATFDCLHDMGDPIGAAEHIRRALTPDGTWLIVEPYAQDTVAGNLNPVGRVYLLLLDVPVRAERAVAVRWLRTRRPVRRGRDPEDRDRCRLHPVPPHRRDAVQPGVRGPALTPSLTKPTLWSVTRERSS
jgi:SAM-dependent methyltransferase